MKVLIVDEMHESILPLLENLGLEVDYFKNFNKEQAAAVIENYGGLLIRSKFYIDDEFLAKAKNLKFIARAGAGLDLIDLQKCAHYNVRVFAANEANQVAVAEHLLGMVLSIFNHMASGSKEVSQHQWLREKNRGEELKGKTVGIIGYGHNGSESAKRFAAFGCKVLVYDRYKKGFGSEQIIETTLEDIFVNADLLSLHVPLTKETHHWVDSTFINKFHKDFYFCNVARGEIMKQTDVVNAIKYGKIKGACLDVLENEKLSTLTIEQNEQLDYLSNHPKVLITPHVAGWTTESYQKINEVLCRQIGQFLKV